MPAKGILSKVVAAAVTSLHPTQRLTFRLPAQTWRMFVIGIRSTVLYNSKACGCCEWPAAGGAGSLMSSPAAEASKVATLHGAGAIRNCPRCTTFEVSLGPSPPCPVPQAVQPPHLAASTNMPSVPHFSSFADSMREWGLPWPAVALAGPGFLHGGGQRHAQGTSRPAAPGATPRAWPKPPSRLSGRGGSHEHEHHSIPWASGILVRSVCGRPRAWRHGTGKVSHGRTQPATSERSAKHAEDPEMAAREVGGRGR